MAARTRRTRFAASFVAVIATSGACSHDAQPTGTGAGTGTAVEPVHPNPPPVANPPRLSPPDAAAPAAIARAWNISKKPDGTCEGFEDQCMARPHAPGEILPPCNPPPSRAFACPSVMTADYVEIVSYDGTSCVVMDTTTPIACPSDAPAAAFVGRRWSVSAGDKNVCWAEPHVDCNPAVVHHTCNPPAASQVTCPPYIAGQDVRETAAGKCETRFVASIGHCPPHAHCNPPPPHDIEVPCPP